MAPVNEPRAALSPAGEVQAAGPAAAPIDTYVSAGEPSLRDHAGDRFTAQLFLLGFALLGLTVLGELLAGLFR